MVLDKIPNTKLFTQRDVRETPTEILTEAERVPVGGVLAWLKTLTGTPSIPLGYVECSGQVLNDPESVYDGATIPDLNGNNNFLRGNATSGGTGGESTHTLTTAEMPAHTHTGDGGTWFAMYDGNAWESGNGIGSYDHTTASAGGGGAHENKPPYYNVVWIIRVK